MSGLSGPRAQRGPCPVALLFLFLLGPSSVLAISFHLPVNSRKCLREEIHKDLLVTGAYEITDQSAGAVDLRTHLKVRPGVGGSWAMTRESIRRAEAKGVGPWRGRLAMDTALPPRVGVGGARPGTLRRAWEDVLTPEPGPLEFGI